MRLWPRNMTGQVMLAVAVALLFVQGLGAFLVFQAQNERREAAFVNAAAFRIAGEARGGPVRNGDRPPPGNRAHRDERSHGFRVMHSPVSPVKPGERRNAMAEAMLARVLQDQDIHFRQLVVVHRELHNDPVSQQRMKRREAFYGRSAAAAADSEVMIAAVQLAGRDNWIVARVWADDSISALAAPLIAQTILIYIVLVTVVALVMRRITRPLAKITGRLEQFAQTRNLSERIEPEGPTDIRRLIEAHNAMEGRITTLLDEKDVMLGAIGHDLKTPLAALRVRIESVTDENERQKMAATIEDITRSLDDMLSLARVGRPTDPPERVEISALLASIVEEYEDMGEPVELVETGRMVVVLRPTWLRRALRNLIDNAVRYGGTARVSLDRTGGNPTIVVEDEGPGIPEADITQMMDPFTRGDPSRNTGTGGTGLGLALARAIADQHGGSLTLRNRPEGGLRAEISLPG